MINWMRPATLLLVTTALAGCSLAPEPILPGEHLERAHADFEKLFADMAPIDHPLSLEEAIARGLKFNYDNQLAKTEQTLQDRQMDLALTQMLPRLAVDAGYSWRNNDNAARSVDEFTGQTSLDYSYSTQRDHASADLQFSWNTLDLGVSYFQARQQGYRALVAVERRRKVINTIVKEVRTAYWKAVTAQNLLPRLTPILAQAETALEASRQVHRDQLQPPLQTLEYQQNMLQVISQLRRLRTDLLTAQAQLSGLINVAPGTAMTLSAKIEEHNLPAKLDVDVHKLEELGLVLRPELREEAYQEKIDRQNVYKEMVKMVPGVSLLASVNWDSNKYEYHEAWNEMGVRASYNLINLIQGPQALQAAEAGVEVAKTRRLALSVAVLTQINLAVDQYQHDLDTLDTAVQVNAVQQEIAKTISNGVAADSQSDVEKIRRFLTATAAELERDRALADTHGALGNLYMAIGVDLVPPNADTSDMAELTARVKGAVADWEAGRLPPLPELPPEPEKVSSAEPETQAKP